MQWAIRAAPGPERGQVGVNITRPRLDAHARFVDQQLGPGVVDVPRRRVGDQQAGDALTVAGEMVQGFG
jgi:hypothetical protein